MIGCKKWGQPNLRNSGLENVLEDALVLAAIPFGLGIVDGQNMIAQREEQEEPRRAAELEGEQGGEGDEPHQHGQQKIAQGMFGAHEPVAKAGREQGEEQDRGKGAGVHGGFERGGSGRPGGLWRRGFGGNGRRGRWLGEVGRGVGGIFGQIKFFGARLGAGDAGRESGFAGWVKGFF